VRTKTNLTKILNPLTKPKPKTQHSFRLHEDLKHQSFPSSTHPWNAREPVRLKLQENMMQFLLHKERGLKTFLIIQDTLVQNVKWWSMKNYFTADQRYHLFSPVDLTSSCVSVDFASKNPSLPRSLPPMESPENRETKGALVAVCTLTVKSVT